MSSRSPWIRIPGMMRYTCSVIRFTCDHAGDPGGGIVYDRRHIRTDVRLCAFVRESTDCKTW